MMQPDPFCTFSYAAATVTKTPADKDDKRGSAKKKIAGGLAALYAVFGVFFFLALAFTASVFGYVLLNIR